MDPLIKSQLLYQLSYAPEDGLRGRAFLRRREPGLYIGKRPGFVEESLAGQDDGSVLWIAMSR